eukprot:769549-Pyramimonas_sp.AAC.1
MHSMGASTHPPRHLPKRTLDPEGRLANVVRGSVENTAEVCDGHFIRCRIRPILAQVRNLPDALSLSLGLL